MYQQEHELWSAMTPLFTKQWGDQKDISRGCAIFVMDTCQMEEGQSFLVFLV